MTWRFAAKNVRDVVWAASPDYMWDASSWKGTHGVTPTIARARSRRGRTRPTCRACRSRNTRSAGSSIPIRRSRAVEGPISGMEYPMVAMENKSADKYDLYNVVTHEIGHMWYPDDRRLERANAHVAGRRLQHLHQLLLRGAPLSGEGRLRRRASQHDREQRRAVHAAQRRRAARDQPRSHRPAAARRERVREDRRSACSCCATRSSARRRSTTRSATTSRRWAFKHPTPTDFFRTMEDVERHAARLVLPRVVHREPALRSGDRHRRAQADGRHDSVVGVLYANHARGVLPIHARFTFTDGSTQDFDYPAEVWSTNTMLYAREYAFAGKKLARIELDPEKRLVDVDRSNNTWPAGRVTP